MIDVTVTYGSYGIEHEPDPEQVKGA